VKNWGEWEIIRRRVALCGRVVHGNDSPAGEAKVTITDAPKKFKARAKTSAAVAAALRNERLRPEVTLTRPDGIFFFLDLPGGDYTVVAECPFSKERGQNHGKISWDKDGNVQRAVADIKLSSG
jgi:hypothetical protein